MLCQLTWQVHMTTHIGGDISHILAQGANKRKKLQEAAHYLELSNRYASSENIS